MAKSMWVSGLQQVLYQGLRVAKSMGQWPWTAPLNGFKLKQFCDHGALSGAEIFKSEHK